MSESVKLENRRKQLRYRANHRGIKEMDIIFGRYADEFIDGFGNKELDEFEALMSFNDRDLLTWFTGEQDLPPDMDLVLFDKVSDFANRHLQSGRFS